MTYLIAVLSLGAACALWVLVQRWAKPGDESSCEQHGPGCRSCGLQDSGCPMPPPDRDRDAREQRA